MKKVVRFIFSRVFVFSLLILLQVLFVLFLIFYLSRSAGVVYILLSLLSAVLVVWMYTRDGSPAYKLIWALVMLSLPVFGSVIYLLVDPRKVPRKTRRKLAACAKAVGGLRVQDAAVASRLESADGRLSRQADYIRATASAPVYENTQARYFELGERFFESLVEELKKARRFIFLEYFIVDDGEMWDAVFAVLREKAARGVDVRVIYDDIGTIMLLPKGFDGKLRQAGIRAAVFNRFKPGIFPIMNFRDHRKICVIDGNVGYTGGINIADEYINAFEKHGHWKDTAVMLRGRAVWSLTCAFLEMWSFVTEDRPEFRRYAPDLSGKGGGFIQPYADSPLDRYSVSENAYINMILRAEKYVYITTPYLILDNELATALCVAAQSGIDVRIITPGIPDKRLVYYVTQSFYGTLTAAGVKIYEYTPGFMHAKMFVSDDRAAIVGSANLDYRSLYMHFECCVAFYFSQVVLDVKRDIEKTLEKCTLITPEILSATPGYMRLLQKLLRIVAPLM